MYDDRDEDDSDTNVRQRDEDTYVIDGSLDPDKVEEDRVEETLPKLHESEREDTFLDKLKFRLGKLDGPMAVSQATIPARAEDIGDVDERANPRAGDLGYPEGYELAVEKERGRVVFSDPPNWALAGDTHLHADPDDVIEDVREFA